MALRYAVLGMLSLGEHTGYELSKRFNGSIGSFWSAKHSQIYPELARLLEAGWVACRAVEQVGRPDKKVYTLTAAGRAELLSWLEAPCEGPTVKEPLLLRAFCAGTGDRRILATQIEEAMHAQQDRLYVYRALEQELEAQGETDPAHPWFGSFLTLRFAMMQASAYIAWCEWALEQVRP